MKQKHDLYTQHVFFRYKCVHICMYAHTHIYRKNIQYVRTYPGLSRSSVILVVCKHYKLRLDSAGLSELCNDLEGLCFSLFINVGG